MVSNRVCARKVCECREAATGSECDTNGSEKCTQCDTATSHECQACEIEHHQFPDSNTGQCQTASECKQYAQEPLTASSDRVCATKVPPVQKFRHTPARDLCWVGPDRPPTHASLKVSTHARKRFVLGWVPIVLVLVTLSTDSCQSEKFRHLRKRFVLGWVRIAHRRMPV